MIRRNAEHVSGASRRSSEQPARVIITEEPRNAETPLHALREALTPARHFFMRNHFQIPYLDPEEWRLRVAGAVARPFVLSLADLRRLPARSVTATLECAGNGRIGFAPAALGEPWGIGGVSTGKWRGVPLSALLERAGLSRETVELVFEGADRGRLADGADVISFVRSLAVEQALDPDTLLAYELNGAALPPDQGGPVRLVVPGWYGMASVKWLLSIDAVEQPFAGYFQAGSYLPDRSDRSGPEPSGRMRVKAIISAPAIGDSVRLGRNRITGVAWSGHSAIARVEVSIGAEGAWQPARLVGVAERHGWQQWEYDWEATLPERYVLRARATDEHGNTQPETPEWNRFGYANNAIQRVVVQAYE